MASRELNIVIRAKNLAGAAIKGVKKELGSIQKDIGKGLKTGFGNIEKGIGVGVAAAAGGIAYAVKQAGDFEAALNTINTVAQVSQTQLDGIGQSLRNLAKSTGTPLEDLSTSYYDLVSAGISAADAQNVLTQANTLAIGGLGTTAETVDLLTTAINSYGGDASKAKEYTDQFAVAIANGKVTAADLAANFADVGPLAAAMGVGIDQISASIGNMTAKGTHAPEAFTQIRAAMVALQRQTPALKKVMKQLGITNIQTELDSKGLAGTWDELRKQAEKTGVPIIKMTGRVEGQQYVLQNTGDALDDYTRNLKDVKNASADGGEAARQMAERQKGLNFQLAKLKANAKDAAITIGSKLIPKLVPLFEKLNSFIQAHQGDIERFGDQLALAFQKGAEWAAKLDWKGIANSLKMAADFSKGLVEAFLAMPDWVKQAVITGWGLNKLTGGAVGSIIGSLGSGLIKGVLGMNAGVVNINAGVVNGGGGGGVPTPAGGKVGSFAKGAIKFVLPIAAGVLIANAIREFAGITPEQSAESQRHGQFGPRSAANVSKGILPAVAGTLGSKPLPVADPVLAGLERRNASEYNRIITGNLAKLSSHVTAGIQSHAALERADLRALHGATDRVGDRLGLVHAATVDAARATRSVPPALSRIEGVERGANGSLNTIAHKNFTPKVDVFTTVNTRTSITVKALAQARVFNSFTTASGRRGGELM